MAFLDKLLPCPFCGGKATLVAFNPNKDIPGSYGFLECTKCAVMTGSVYLGSDDEYDPDRLSILEARWNRRWSGCQTE